MTGADLLQGALGLGEIAWINLILSGDNAVVIALACRDLPPRIRRTGMALGAGVAIVLRVAFTALIAALLGTPFVRIVGGLLLVWIAIRLVAVDDGEDEGPVAASDRLWSAVRTVVVADAVMSLDNVLAVAAVAHGSTPLLVLGLLLSIPLIVAGASVILVVLERWPALVWAGAVLLGWVAGEMLVSDPWLAGRFGPGRVEGWTYPGAAAGAATVLVAGWLLRRRRAPPSPGGRGSGEGRADQEKTRR